MDSAVLEFLNCQKCKYELLRFLTTLVVHTPGPARYYKVPTYMGYEYDPPKKEEGHSP